MDPRRQKTHTCTHTHTHTNTHAHRPATQQTIVSKPWPGRTRVIIIERSRFGLGPKELQSCVATLPKCNTHIRTVARSGIKLSRCHLFLNNLLCFSINIMLRVSFSPGRSRACRHCWISPFWTPLGKLLLYSYDCLSKRPFRQYL